MARLHGKTLCDGIGAVYLFLFPKMRNGGKQHISICIQNIMDPVYISPARTLRSGIPEYQNRISVIPEFWNAFAIIDINDITLGGVNTWQDYLGRLSTRHAKACRDMTRLAKTWQALARRMTRHVRTLKRPDANTRQDITSQEETWQDYMAKTWEDLA